MDAKLLKLLQKIQLPNCAFEPVGVISEQFVSRGITDLYSAIDHVYKLKYAHNSQLYNWYLTLPEQRGMSGVRHALLVELAKEIGVPFELGHGIYIMSAKNYPIIRDVLRHEGLPYLPASRDFIIYDEQYLDITIPGYAQILDPDELEFVQTLACHDLAAIKTRAYPKYIEEWLNDQHIHMTIRRFWEIYAKVDAVFANQTIQWD